MYGCESWTVKKAERRRIDAFELWCWRRLLRVPWTARRSNQSILKELSLGISLEGMMLKLKLQYFGHCMRRVDSLEKTHAGRDWRQEEKGTTEDEMAGWHHWLDGCESEWTPEVGDGQGGLACCDSWGRKESDTTEWLIWSDLSARARMNWSVWHLVSDMKTISSEILTIKDIVVYVEKTWAFGSGSDGTHMLLSLSEEIVLKRQNIVLKRPEYFISWLHNCNSTALCVIKSVWTTQDVIGILSFRCISGENFGPRECQVKANPSPWRRGKGRSPRRGCWIFE